MDHQSPPMKNGTLFIEALSGRKLKNTELFFKMSPYLTFELAYLKKKLVPDHNGGRNPKWNQSLSMEVRQGRELLRVTCMDKDMMTDDLVGVVEIDVREVVAKGFVDQWFTLRHPKKNKEAGEIRLVIRFMEDDEQEKQERRDVALEVEGLITDQTSLKAPNNNRESPLSSRPVSRSSRINYAGTKHEIDSDEDENFESRYLNQFNAISNSIYESLPKPMQIPRPLPPIPVGVEPYDPRKHRTTLKSRQTMDANITPLRGLPALNNRQK
ncbi:C2 calcium/lipid-binding, CaLB domain-containing protein [Rozella allomycis CSF55]|uniref:C2 calcium/lipid-binding, CaLB domain-containing protein n=1 Tax=Rozella allomycis (strain CSF55) TaxID=988480 RepID=A0A075AZ95_ROZAC|nr:C2 calcium/lipid-binding, CaLB domain-containing protein [Rozella allomycis CSF55]|eukprot:EPZ35595.1 C2 calcium/lipid-binding, CaLB domain-containing protein [Rozella allomycis CSF55]